MADNGAAEQKFCVVTGSNSGLGKEVAAGLMREGAHVVMACRNMQACEVARKELQQAHPQGTAECSKLDLEDKESIEGFAARTKQQLGRRKLDILVNNAGIMGVSNYPDGRDRHLWVNHLGPYLLTRLLLPAMGEGGRVINMASRASLFGSLSLREGLIRDDPGFWFQQYARSKLCNVLFTRELQRRVGSRGIQAHAISPGMVNTPLFANGLPWYASTPMKLLAPILGRTPAKGAETAIYAAVSPQMQGSTELFLHDCKPLQASAQGRDPQLAKDLWEASEALIGPGKDCKQSYV